MSSFTNELGKNIMEIATNDDSLQELDGLNVHSSELTSSQNRDDDGSSDSSDSCDDMIPQECIDDEETSSMSEESETHEPIAQKQVTRQQTVICNTNDKPSQPVNIKPVSPPKSNPIVNTGNPPIQVQLHPINTMDFAETSISKDICLPTQQNKIDNPAKALVVPKLLGDSLPINSMKKAISNNSKIQTPSVQQQIMKKPLEQKKVRFDNSKLTTTIPLSPKLSNTQIACVAQSAIQRATQAFHMPVTTLYFFIALLCIGIGFYLYHKYVAKAQQTQ